MSEATSQSKIEPVGGGISQAETSDEKDMRAAAIRRAIGMTFSPEATLRDINQRPSWMFPFLFAIAVSVAFSIFLGIKLDIGARSLVLQAKTQIAEKSEGKQIAAQDVETLASAVKGILVASAIFGRAILFLVLSVVFAGSFSLMRAPMSFRKVMSVIAWSNLVPHICSILVAVISLEIASAQQLENTNPFNFNSLMVTNLAGVLGNNISLALSSVLSSMDIFVIWFLILLTMGFSAMAKETSITKAKAGGVVFGLWIVWVIAKVGFVIVFG